MRIVRTVDLGAFPLEALENFVAMSRERARQCEELGAASAAAQHKRWTDTLLDERYRRLSPR